MSRQSVLSPVFVDHVPEQLADGTLYVSIPFATAIHECCCGCGTEIVTPLSPTDWRLTFDGDSVSLDPSIGNWGLRCRSHYWIEKNRVRWAPTWSRDEIEEGRAADRAAKAAYYGGTGEVVAPTSASATPASGAWWRRLLRRD